MTRTLLTLSEARRIALGAQGFGRPRPAAPVRAEHLRRIIRQLGLVQLDYVNVLVPAHYMVFFSRLGPYKRSLLEDVVYRGREFTEHWAHEASIVPMDAWPLLRHRMESHRPRPWGFDRFMKEHADFAQAVLEAVRTKGPLAAGDLAALEYPPGTDQSNVGRIAQWLKEVGSWIGTAERGILEAHFGRGLLAVAERRANFSRSYDLAERIIPAEHFSRKVEHEEAERELLRRAARSCGVATADDLADYYRMPIRSARQRIAELVEAGDLREVDVEGWRQKAYLHPEARPAASLEIEALLAPFDPLIWYRPRVARLFDFEYRIEIFVPQPKRRWGYYVLPFLLGDSLVARVDLKAERAQGKLMVLALYLESSIKKAGIARRTAITALGRELRAMAGWLGLDGVVVGQSVPRNLAVLLRPALTA
jgi:uncharacterized protein YcaQ